MRTISLNERHVSCFKFRLVVSRNISAQSDNVFSEKLRAPCAQQRVGIMAVRIELLMFEYFVEYLIEYSNIRLLPEVDSF